MSYKKFANWSTWTDKSAELLWGWQARSQILTSGEREVVYVDTLVSFKCYFHSMFTKIPYPMLQVAAVSPGRHSQYKKH